MPGEKNTHPLSYEQLKQHMIDPELPGVTVIQILEGASKDEALPEHERAHARAWLDRLVDEQGNPKDDFGRDPLQAAAEDNSLSMNGSLTTTERHDDRDVLKVIVSHRCRAIDREKFRAQLKSHLSVVADEFTEHLYDAGSDDS